MAYKTLDLQDYANNRRPLSRKKFIQDRDKQTLPKFLCCYRIYATVLQNNSGTICYCLIEQTMYTSCYMRLCITATHIYNKKISKKKYKKVYGHTILQIKGKIKEPHSESEQILVKNLQDKPTVGQAPQRSRQFCFSR